MVKGDKYTNTSEEAQLFGKKNWFFPDGELPPAGNGELLGHESLVILNPNDLDATAEVLLYFASGTKPRSFTTTVDAQSVRCLRTNVLEDMGGIEIPLSTQYALSIHSDVPVIAQYGRLDNRQPNLAYYTTPGYAE